MWTSSITMAMMEAQCVQLALMFTEYLYVLMILSHKMYVVISVQLRIAKDTDQADTSLYLRIYQIEIRRPYSKYFNIILHWI